VAVQRDFVGFEFEPFAVDVVDGGLQGLILERFDLAALVADDVVMVVPPGVPVTI